MSEAGKAVCEWLAAHRGEMLELLEAAVNIDSGSSHKPGADRMADLVEPVLKGAGLSTQRHKLATHGDCVSASSAVRVRRTCCCSATWTRCFRRARLRAAPSGSTASPPTGRVWPT